MKGNFSQLTETEYQRLTEANTKAAFDYLEALMGDGNDS